MWNVSLPSSPFQPAGFSIFSSPSHSLSRSLSLSFGYIHMSSLLSEGHSVNPNINNEWKRVGAPLWPPACVLLCIRSLCECVGGVTECVCVCGRIYLIGGRWWQRAVLCLPPLYSPSERCDCPRLAWNSETHKGRHHCPVLFLISNRSDRSRNTSRQTIRHDVNGRITARTKLHRLETDIPLQLWSTVLTAAVQTGIISGALVFSKVVYIIWINCLNCLIIWLCCQDVPGSQLWTGWKPAAIKRQING